MSAERCAARMAVAEINALARRMRAQGTDVSVAVYSQEGRMCIQFLLQNGEKVNNQQEIKRKQRIIKSAVLHDR